MTRIPVPGWATSPGTVSTSGSSERSIVREFATTEYPSLRYAVTSPAPMPCDAPVITATFWEFMVLLVLEGLYFDGCRTMWGFPRPVSSLLGGSAYQGRVSGSSACCAALGGHLAVLALRR